MDFPERMKSSWIVILLLALPLVLSAQDTNDVPVAAADRTTATQEKHLQPILAALHLTNEVAVESVRLAWSKYFSALNTWHALHDAEVKTLWNNFNQARSAKDAMAADSALVKIDSAYAGLQPQHAAFLTSLATVLSPAQVETVKDVLTVNKVGVTYAVYLQIFPHLTEAQKAVVLAKLKDAREQAMDAGSMAEKSAFFKKYKIEIEDVYLTAQGYDPKQARQDFAKRQKAGGGK